jgi:pimeloyl-ACP methyl ester carboxylesterase
LDYYPSISIQLPKMENFSASKLFGLALFASLSYLPSQVQGQAAPVALLNTIYNSSFALTPEQISAANLSDDLVFRVNTVINADRSGLANGGPREDDFYTLPAIHNSAQLKPGEVLKIQEAADTFPFAISPGTTLSRILYTSETLNGTVVPASAYVLWPFASRQFPSATNGSFAPVILWTHGTSGFFADAAPSAYRSLQYGDMMPFWLAQAGYTVVAPDYAGLGVGQSWDGSEIPHQYFVGPSGARDAIFSLQAARTAFKGRLDGKFAVMGHSQGGGVAWATAEYVGQLQKTAGSLAKELSDTIKGYVGTVALAPVTKAWEVGTFATIMAGMRLGSIFSDFSLDQWFTPAAIARIDLIREIQGSSSVAQQLFLNSPASDFLKPGWYNGSYHARSFEGLGNAGGRDFAGPLMVVQGTQDVFISHDITSASVEATCQINPDNHLTYVVVDGYGHTPLVGATRLTYIQWLEDRFSGKDAQSGCSQVDLEGVEGSAQAGNSFPQWTSGLEHSYLNVGSV